MAYLTVRRSRRSLFVADLVEFIWSIHPISSYSDSADSLEINEPSRVIKPTQLHTDLQLIEYEACFATVDHDVAENPCEVYHVSQNVGFVTLHYFVRGGVFFL